MDTINHAALTEHKQDVSSQPPVLKVRPPKSKDIDYEGIEEGEYFILFNGVKKPMGKSPVVVLMQHKTSYSWFKDELLAWTTEFNDFDFFQDEKQIITLSHKTDNGIVDAFKGTQMEFYDWKKKISTTQEGEQVENPWKDRLSYKHIYYVYLPEAEMPAKFFISNTSFNGIPEGADRTDFKNPQNNSFAMYHEKLGYNKGFPLYAQKHTLGTVLSEGGISDFFYSTIEDSVNMTDDELTLVGKQNDQLQTKASVQIEAPASQELPDIPDVQYASDVKPEDLPF